MENNMKIRLFPYYGSKSRLSNKYPAPMYPKIIEPFAGSAGYSCRHYRNEIHLYEANKKIYDTLRFLIDATKKDILDLPVLGFSDSVDDFDIPDGAKHLIGFWCNHGCSSPPKRLSTWGKQTITKSPDTTRFWGSSRREILSKTVMEINHWQVFYADYNDALSQEYATWFIDPPYQKMGYAYKNRNINYESLGTICTKLNGHVIACENADADWLPFRKLTEHHGVRKTKKKNVEVFWVNNDRFGNKYFMGDNNEKTKM